MDQLSSRADESNLQSGKIVTLPSTFQGSPRLPQKNYQNAMVMIAKFDNSSPLPAIQNGGK